jgi:NTE family protein
MFNLELHMAKQNTYKVDLALQGGGAHGAYSWGVIDRLLEDEDIELDGVCGTSAGAMNGVCTVYGLAKGGRKHAKQLLGEFWHMVAESGKYSPLRPGWYDRTKSKGNMDFSLGYRMFSMMTDNFSPKQFNPYNFNPLSRILELLIDFDELQQISPPKLFVCATNVLTCEAKVFGPSEITAKAVLASACLPFLFPAVEINGEYFWDGGYMGNPPLFPLIENTPDTNDIMLVQINPFHIHKVPERIEEIRDRVNEISFNSALSLELQNIDLHRKLAREGSNDKKYLNVFLHRISADNDLGDLNHSSKLNTEWDYLCYLRDKGRVAAEKWLSHHKDSLGKRDTLEI